MQGLVFLMNILQQVILKNLAKPMYSTCIGLILKDMMIMNITVNNLKKSSRK